MSDTLEPDYDNLMNNPSLLESDDPFPENGTEAEQTAWYVSRIRDNIDVLNMMKAGTPLEGSLRAIADETVKFIKRLPLDVRPRVFEAARKAGREDGLIRARLMEKIESDMLDAEIEAYTNEVTALLNDYFTISGEENMQAVLDFIDNMPPNLASGQVYAILEFEKESLADTPLLDELQRRQLAFDAQAAASVPDDEYDEPNYDDLMANQKFGRPRADIPGNWPEYKVHRAQLGMIAQQVALCNAGHGASKALIGFVFNDVSKLPEQVQIKTLRAIHEAAAEGTELKTRAAEELDLE